jgi:hypothetical protein
VWAFCDFNRYFDDAKMDVPYRIAPTVRLEMEFEKDLAKLRKIKDSLGEHPHVKPAWTAAIGYARLDDAHVVRRLDHVLRLARESGMPVQLCFDTWWGRTPGGKWSDDQYQQWVWNDTQKKMQRSVPNRWSNTPWLTVNDPDLNAFKIARMKQTVAQLRLRLREQPELRELILAINLDNEPVYWASGNAGLGPGQLEADFNPRAVESARRDGVTLDPADGLSTPERKWLRQNLLNYNTMIGESMVHSLGRDASVVTSKAAAPADDLLANNVYTQAMVAHPALQYPLFHQAWPLWETAAPAAVRCGGEWNDDTVAEQQAVMHHIALGRSAAVNAECGNNASNVAGVQVGYALGERYYTPYNYPLDKMDVATADLRDIEQQQFIPYIHQPALLESDFAGEKWKTVVAEHGGVETGPIGNNPTIAVYPASVTVPGFLRYHLVAPKDKFNALSIEMFGRTKDHQRNNDKIGIRVLVDGQEAGGVNHDGDINAAARIDLTDRARGKKEVDVRIELDAGGAQMRQWCSLWRVRFCIGYPDALLSVLLKQDWSLATVRKQNLLTSWRRDAELAMEKFPTPQAKEAYSHGEYATAYRLSNEAACVALPARFDVQESGALTPYPLRVEGAAMPVGIELRESSTDRIRLTASAKVKIIATSMPMGRHYLQRMTDGECEISANDGGPLIVNEAGELTFDAVGQ